MSFLAGLDSNNSLMAFKPEVTLEALSNFTSANMYIIVGRQEVRLLASFVKLNSLVRATTATDITVVDKINNSLRFNVNYQLQSVLNNTRVVLSTWVSEVNPLLSLQSIYPAFNWAEREVWDMYGVFFIKHPDLRRILTDYGFVGFPLRKDFPLSGFKEVQYEDSVKQVEYSNTELTQSYRLLSFTNPWTK